MKNCDSRMGDYDFTGVERLFGILRQISLAQEVLHHISAARGKNISLGQSAFDQSACSICGKPVKLSSTSICADKSGKAAHTDYHSRMAIDGTRTTFPYLRLLKKA